MSGVGLASLGSRWGVGWGRGVSGGAGRGRSVNPVGSVGPSGGVGGVSVGVEIHRKLTRGGGIVALGGVAVGLAPVKGDIADQGKYGLSNIGFHSRW